MQVGSIYIHPPRCSDYCFQKKSADGVELNYYRRHVSGDDSCGDYDHGKLDYTDCHTDSHSNNSPTITEARYSSYLTP